MQLVFLYKTKTKQNFAPMFESKKCNDRNVWKKKTNILPSRSCAVPACVVCVCFVYVTVSFGGMSVACTETTIKLTGFRLPALRDKNEFFARNLYKK